jgi:acyl carrier protein
MNYDDPPAGRRAEILARVRALALETNPHLKDADVTDRATLASMGLDSVAVVELSVRIEESFGNRVVLDDWINQEEARGEGGYTVGSLVTFIERSLDA